MIIDIIDGDLLELFEQKKFDGIAHGCNCFHAMASGIAGQIAERFPTAVLADNRTPYGDITKLGTFSGTTTEFGTIINMYTQYRPGREQPDQLYRNILQAFFGLSRFTQENYPAKPRMTLGIPQIGCGIAGGNLKEVQEIINQNSPAFDIVMVNYKPKQFVPGLVGKKTGDLLTFSTNM